MRFYTSIVLILSLFLILQAQQCSTPQALHQIKIQMTSTQAYCGGAPPIDEILEELATPKVMSSTALYFYNEDDALVLSTTSDAHGVVRDSLPKGQYFIRKAIKTVPSNNASELDLCLQNWEQRVLDSFSVFSDTSLTTNVYLDCNPCYPPAP